MEQAAALIEAVASLLWPIVVLVVLLLFAPQVREVVRSARSRRFTLKVGGQELSMEEVREQQSRLIADLQKKLGELETAVLNRTEPEATSVDKDRALSSGIPVASPARVLWVDDQPKNISYYVEQLCSGGVEVDIALSTSEALRHLEERQYRVVLSDMGRKEGDHYNPRAGIDLLKALADGAPELPVAFVTSARGADPRRKVAEEMGARLVTSSGTELVRFLRSVFPEWWA
jgi:CheY-like chemotaxis protein